MSSIPSVKPLPSASGAARFGTANPAYTAQYMEFIRDKVLATPLDTAAFQLIDDVRWQEPGKKKGRLKLHDQLSLFLTRPDFQPLFPGINAFVKELRQLLVAAGKIPGFVILIKGTSYRLDEAHRAMPATEADTRLDSLRVAVAQTIRSLKPNSGDAPA